MIEEDEETQLLLAEIAKNRASHVVSDEEKELEWRLQVATADYLRGRIYKNMKQYTRVPIPFHHLKFHHPALEFRGGESGDKYRRRGSEAGIPDWLLWAPKRWHGMIELKVAGRGLNDNQKEVHRWATEYGFPFAICRTVREFRDTIIKWGWVCHNMNCIEPDYRTKEQKQKASFDMYKP